MKAKRYLFAIKFKNGHTKRFYVSTEDPFAKTRDYYKRYDTAEDIVFRQMK